MTFPFLLANFLLGYALVVLGLVLGLAVVLRPATRQDPDRKSKAKREKK